jgi:hypothetical protein
MDAHDLIKERVAEMLRKKGYMVSTEVFLSHGKGAADIVAEKGGVRIVAEVKSSPSSLSGSSKRQIDLYEKNFPSSRCALISPDANGELRIAFSNYQYKGKFVDYLNK